MKRGILLAMGALALLAACEFGAAPGGGTGVDGLTGVVVDGRGNPVEGARVRVYPASEALGKGYVAREDSTLTQADGRYRFKDLPSGIYDLVASIRLEDTAYGLFLAGVVFDKRLDLGVDTLYASGGLSLRVRGEQGAPVSGARCEVRGGRWATVSDSDGVCLFAELPSGHHRLIVRHADAAVPVDVVVASGRRLDAGTATLGLQGGFAPSWRYVSLDGYDFLVPPELELQWERPLPTSQAGAWTRDSVALYVGGGMRLLVGTGIMPVPAWPWDSLPEISPEATVLDDSGAFPIRLVLRGGAVPSTAQGYQSDFPYLARATVTNLGSTGSGVNILEFVGRAATRRDFDTLMKALGTIRKWKGPGAIPRNAPPRTILRSPADGAIDTTGAPTLVWSDHHGSDLVTHYRVEVSLDSAFGKRLYSDSVPRPPVAMSSDPRHAVSLERGAVYFWRVVAYGPGGFTSSEVRRLVAQAPAPRLMFPPEDTADVGTASNFLWEIPAGTETATYYRLQISIDSLFVSPQVDTAVGLPAMFGSYRAFRSGLAHSTRYYWRIVAHGAQGVRPSEHRTFTTYTPVKAAPPPKAQLMQPAEGAVVVNHGGVVLEWAILMDGPTISYRGQLATDSLFTNLVADDSLGTSPTIVPETSRYAWAAAVPAEGRFYWRIVSTTPGDIPSDPVYSAVRSFISSFTDP